MVRMPDPLPDPGPPMNDADPADVTDAADHLLPVPTERGLKAIAAAAGAVGDDKDAAKEYYKALHGAG